MMEIDKLESLLTESKIPFEIGFDVYGGSKFKHIYYPSKDEFYKHYEDEADCCFSIVCNPSSMGYKNGLLEISGCYMDPNRRGMYKRSLVEMGWSSANGTFSCIETHHSWKKKWKRTGE